MGIASEIILGLVEVGGSLLGSYLQSETLSESQEEARRLNQQQIGLQVQQMKSQEKISKEQLRLQKKQLAEQTRLTEEQLAMQQEQNARQSFRDQVSRLTTIVDKNENLKNLYLNRLKGLRS